VDDRQRLTGDEIAAAGLDAWQVEERSLVARFRTGRFAAGVALVERIGEAADALDHHPDVDLRYDHVVVRSRSHDVDALTARDLRLARRIDALAADVGLAPEPPEEAPADPGVTAVGRAGGDETGPAADAGQRPGTAPAEPPDGAEGPRHRGRDV